MCVCVCVCVWERSSVFFSVQSLSLSHLSLSFPPHIPLSLPGSISFCLCLFAPTPFLFSLVYAREAVLWSPWLFVCVSLCCAMCLHFLQAKYPWNNRCCFLRWWCNLNVEGGGQVIWHLLQPAKQAVIEMFCYVMSIFIYSHWRCVCVCAREEDREWESHISDSPSDISVCRNHTTGRHGCVCVCVSHIYVCICSA